MVHSNAPCFHSWNSPANKIIIKIVLVIDHTIKLEYFRIMIIGRIKAISTSKIKKIIVIKKNRKENGNREELLGSKPHSKGDDFSRSILVFFDSSEANIITIKATMKINRTMANIKFIIYINFY